MPRVDAWHATKSARTRLVLALGMLALGALVAWWRFALELPPVSAVVGSPAGMCADSATNLSQLSDLRDRIQAATTSDEIRRIVDEFYSLRTHSMADIEAARNLKGVDKRKERLRGEIAELRANPAAAPYMARLDDLEARLDAAKNNADLDPIEAEIDEIQFTVGIVSAIGSDTGTTQPANTGPTDTGRGTTDRPPLNVPQGEVPASIGDDVPVIGSCRPQQTTGVVYPEGSRGRVRVGHGTVLTDRGTILRAVHAARKRPTEWWRRMRDEFGFNTVRLDVRFTSFNTNQGGQDSMSNLLSESQITQIVQELDYAVAKAKEMGMYVIITNFTSCCGQYNEEVDRFFWRTIAPRYKDETHVIYELHNEPVGYPGWSCSTQWQRDMVREYSGYMVRLYQLVRSLAPQTHIILWTPMYSLADHGKFLYAWVTGTQPQVSGPEDSKYPMSCWQDLFSKVAAGQNTIDYTNASVGIHAYPGHVWGQPTTQVWSWVERLRNEGYPVFVTEFSQFCDDEPYETNANISRIFSYLEDKQISWAYLECFKPLREDGTRGGGGNFGVGIMLSCSVPWLWQTPSP
ncbi:hypothetical protein D6792_02520 [Candidatus Parcubacteria bacterium]|nr:MAG: hypothetical protein D6792_02520 [Candidatus Parcubacteria bacterium]GIW68820.1 MAG: hypothetical protein KatS3mg100_314 [Candidatus Parcubacteria bacterium]